MALYDWNQNGKDDMQNNFIEYQIYKDVTGQNDKPDYTPSRGSGMSTFGAFLCVIGGFVGVAFIFTLFGVDVEKVPVFVIIILLIIVTSIIAGVVSSFKER